MASKVVTQSYTIFIERCRGMVNSKFVMSSNSISNILQLIASVPCLTNYVQICSQNFDFNKEYNKATASLDFILPSENKKIVAFVTNLLFMFDQKKLDLTKFIKTYYSTNDFELSYKTFCDKVINPYMIAFKDILLEEDKAAPDYLDNTNVTEFAKNQCMGVITSLISIVSQDNNLSDEKKSDFLTMLEGFFYSFEISRAQMIKVVWIGLKNIMSSYRPAQSYLMSIEKVLQDYAVI